MNQWCDLEEISNMKISTLQNVNHTLNTLNNCISRMKNDRKTECKMKNRNKHNFLEIHKRKNRRTT